MSTAEISNMGIINCTKFQLGEFSCKNIVAIPSLGNKLNIYLVNQRNKGDITFLINSAQNKIGLFDTFIKEFCERKDIRNKVTLAQYDL